MSDDISESENDETGRLLSYFLGSDGNGGGSQPPSPLLPMEASSQHHHHHHHQQQQQNQQQNSQHHQEEALTLPSSTPNPPHPPYPPQPGAPQYNYNYHHHHHLHHISSTQAPTIPTTDTTTPTTTASLPEIEPILPPTPAIQYYHHASSNASSIQQAVTAQTTPCYTRTMPPHTYHYQHPPPQHHNNNPSVLSKHSTAQTLPLPSTNNTSLSSLISNHPIAPPQPQQQSKLVIHPQHHMHVQFQQQQQPEQFQQQLLPPQKSAQHTPLGDASSISPAALVMAEEQLMLPPPSRHLANTMATTSATTSASTSSSPQKVANGTTNKINNSTNSTNNINSSNGVKSDAEKKSHIAWLQEINSRASIPPNAIRIQMPIPPLPQQQPHMAILPPMSHPPHMSQTIPFAAMYNPKATVISHSHLQAAMLGAESEEKRARRLERNRESARKSRRRKKERLAALEKQVDSLHTQIETERRAQINVMNTELMSSLQGVIPEELLATDFTTNQANSSHMLAAFIQSHGLNCNVRRAVVDFQYNLLKRTMLPSYQKFLLWLTLHEETYFLAGKQQYISVDRNQALRGTVGRISSKQIGDELTNGASSPTGEGTAGTGGSKRKSQKKATQSDDKENRTVQAFDAPRLWPLLCYELSISVDQEERLTQTFKSLQPSDKVKQERSQIAAGIRMSSNLMEAIMFQSHVVAVRNEKVYLNTLTPTQTVKCQKWFAKHQSRVQEIVRKPKRSITPPALAPSPSSSLLELCLRLEAVLKITKSSGNDTQEA